MTRIVFALIALALVAGTAQAQSFNCRHAKLPTEVAICQDAELRSLDSQMAALYFSLSPAVRSYERGEQKSWLAYRDGCGYNPDCIYRAYRQRIDELRRY